MLRRFLAKPAAPSSAQRTFAMLARSTADGRLTPLSSSLPAYRFVLTPTAPLLLTQARYQSIHQKNVGEVAKQRPTLAAKQDPRERMSKLRNIGIVAHIDAGKTTTTERILYYSGAQRNIGEVDRGTTTTDFLEEETQRGITITAAAVHLQWKDYTVNLIDTPGHVDFSIEVERSLRVLDGVVAVFDAAVGVQAQSYTVLRMAKRSKTPVIAFINKMDKPTADFNKAVRSIRDKLRVTPLILQLPLTGDDGAFLGMLDVVRRCSIVNTGPRGETLVITPYEELLPHRREAIDKAHHDIIALLTSVDDVLATKLIEALDATDGDEALAETKLKETDIDEAIRRQVLKGLRSFEATGGAHSTTDQTLMPILCGASRRNAGVQPLMDAVTRYLPSPLDRPPLEGFTEAQDPVPVPPPLSPINAAMAFKVMFFPDPRKGNELRPLVFFRVYCGSVEKNAKVKNHRSKDTVPIGSLFVLQGNTLIEVEDIKTGGIGATFSDKFVTGDTLFAERKGLAHRRADRPDDATSAFHTFEPIVPPSPVVSHAVEAEHSSDIEHLKKALNNIGTEDPTLVTRVNEHGQLVVSGMGELHVEVSMSRMKRQFNVQCNLAKAIIEYREGVTTPTVVGPLVVGTGGSPRLVELGFEIRPLLNDDPLINSDMVANPSVIVTCKLPDEVETQFCDSVAAEDRHNREVTKRVKADWKTLRAAAVEACQSVTAMGKLGIKMTGCVFVVTHAKRLQENLPHRELVQALQRTFIEAIRSTEKPAVLEPMMDVTVILSEDSHRANVFSLLNERLATYIAIDEDESVGGTVIKAVVPMRTIVKFSNELRKSSKGNAHYWTTLRCYKPVSSEELRGRILSVLGHKQQ